MLPRLAYARNMICTPTSESFRSRIRGVSERYRTHDIVRWAFLFVCVLGLTIVAAQPAVADHNSDSSTTNPVCQDKSHWFAQAIEGIILILVAVGLIGVLIVLLIEELMSMFTLDPERKEQIRRHKRGTLKSGSMIAFLPPLFTVAMSMMGLPIARCIDFVPF